MELYDVQASTPQGAGLMLTEADVQRGIRDLLERLGFAVFHTRFAIGSDTGFPDVVALSADGLIIAIECKGPKGRIRPGQREWIERFARVPSCLVAAIVGPESGKDWIGYDEALELIRFEVEDVRTVHITEAS